MQLALDGRVRCAELVTHRVPVRDAAALFELIDKEPQSVLQSVLDFSV